MFYGVTTGRQVYILRQITLPVLPKVTNLQREIRHFQASKFCQLGTIKPFHLYLGYEELLLKCCNTLTAYFQREEFVFSQLPVSRVSYFPQVLSFAPFSNFCGKRKLLMLQA